MATMPNSLLLPGNNPSGNQLTVPYGVPSTPSGGNPLMPQVPGGPLSTNANPYGNNLFPAFGSPYQSTPLVPSGGTTPVPTSGMGGAGAGATGVSPTGTSLGVPSTNAGENKLLQTLNKTYGAGLGTAMYNFLAGGAGFNQDAINNLLAAMQPQFEASQENLMTQFSASGNRFGSGAQLGLADLASQEQLDVGQLETQMYENSVNDFISVLMGTAGPSASRKQQPGFLDQFLSGISGTVPIGKGSISI